MRVLRGLTVAVAAAITTLGTVVAAAPAQALAPDDWYLTVGPGQECGTGYIMKEPWCGPVLMVRDPELRSEDDLVWPTQGMTGPNGPVGLNLDTRPFDTRSWPGWPPAPEYRGRAFYTYTPTGLAPGRYTYVLKVNVSGRWSCSMYNEDGCSWLDGSNVRYEYTFDWDGANPVTVAPTWKLRAVPAKICGPKGCALVVSYDSNLPLLAKVEVQRKTAGGKWKTVDTDKAVGGSGWIYDESAKRGKTYYYRLRTTDPSHQTSKVVKIRF